MTILFGIAILLIGYLTGLNLGIYLTKKELSKYMVKEIESFAPCPCAVTGTCKEL